MVQVLSKEALQAITDTLILHLQVAVRCAVFVTGDGKDAIMTVHGKLSEGMAKDKCVSERFAFMITSSVWMLLTVRFCSYVYLSFFNIAVLKKGLQDQHTIKKESIKYFYLLLMNFDC